MEIMVKIDSGQNSLSTNILLKTLNESVHIQNKIDYLRKFVTYLFTLGGIRLIISKSIPMGTL